MRLKNWQMNLGEFSSIIMKLGVQVNKYFCEMIFRYDTFYRGNQTQIMKKYTGDISMVPTGSGKTIRHFPVRDFDKTEKVAEFLLKILKK